MSERERWNARYREGGPGEPSAFLQQLDLPHTGRALDVAGGLGRNALWLAQRGLDVTLVDVSDVALARVPAPVQTLLRDLEAEPLPAGPWDVIVCANYLQRSLFPQLVAALAPDGWLVVEHPTRTNLQRHEHPSARFLLDDGELPALVAPLRVIRYEEGWTGTGRHEARLVARRIA